MGFNSIKFAVFFIVFYAIYLFAVQKRIRHENLLLLVGSLIFYGAWDYRFLPLILSTVTLDYYLARLIEITRDHGRRRLFLLCSVIYNLGILGIFKYLDFGIETFNLLLSSIGIESNLYSLRIILPIGISFYTFQSISYVVDVYRNRIKSIQGWQNYTLFITFFPQLVAGPIERAEQLYPQLIAPKKITRECLKQGIFWVFMGYFLKIVIADSMAPLVNAVFENPGEHDGIVSALAIFAFSFQIFGDFAGYSLIARGIASLLGIRLIQNFNAPYLASDMRDFWHRWHISLSQWLRDYLYIPLGGNRTSTVRRKINLFLTMLLGGLWHGAAWNFVLWGGFHGLLLSLTKRNRKRNSFGFLRTYLLVCMGWFLFRVPDMPTFLQLSRNIVFDFNWTLRTGSFLIPTLTAGIFVMAYQYLQYRENKELSEFPMPVHVQWAGYVFIGICLLALGRSQVPFIYFQF